MGKDGMPKKPRKSVNTQPPVLSKKSGLPAVPHNKFPVHMRKAFLTALEQTGNARKAARLIGLHRNTAYLWAREDPEGFGELMHQARFIGRQTIADELEERIFDRRSELSDFFLLKAYRPEFRENYQTQIDMGETNIKVVVVNYGK